METTPILARDLATLGRMSEGASFESVLRGITEAVARGVPGCAGSTAELWLEERVLLAASHSELVALTDQEHALREGPSREAFSAGRPVVVADVMRDPRWPRYATTAVRHGIRSVMVLPIKVDHAMVIIGLFAVRPGVFTAGSPLMTVLAEQVAVALTNIWEFDDVTTGAAQLQEALAGRSIIDQAKGIIMASSGCSAEAAFDELRRVSQHHQVKVADLAKLLVTEHQRKHDGDQPG